MRNVITAAILLIASFTLGCGGKSPAQQASLLGNRPFSVEEWASADQVARGRMVASFLQANPGAGQRKQDVIALLGQPTGYYDYDENLAYVVGPVTVNSEYAKCYLLVFEMDKLTGKVKRVAFVPEVEP